MEYISQLFQNNCGVVYIHTQYNAPCILWLGLNCMSNIFVLQTNHILSKTYRWFFFLQLNMRSFQYALETSEIKLEI